MVKKRDNDWGTLIHAAVGTAVGGLAAGFGGGTTALVTTVVLLAGGVGREYYQHWDDRPRMNGHRWLEGLIWAVGGIAGSGLGLLVGG